MDVNGGTIVTLGVRVEQTGVNEAKAEVISYGTVGEQSAAKVKAAFDATARSQQVLAGQLNALTQMTQQWNSAGAQAQDMARRIATELAREGEMAGASAAQVRQLADAQRVLAGNTEEAVVATEAENAVLAEQAVVGGAAFTGMGRIRQGLVSLVAQSTGTIPVLDRIGVALLGMSIENPVILGVLAGIAAIAFAYKAFAGDTKKAAEEQEHLNKVRQEFLDKQGRPAGDLGTSQTNLSDTVNQQRAQLAALTAQRDSLVSDGAIERANTLNEKIIALTKTYDDNANQLKVLTVEKDRLQNAAKEAVAQSALEVEHQAALNAAFGQSAYVIDQINASYKLRSDRIRDAAAATNEEKVKMDALAQAQHDVTVEAARLSTGVAELESKQTELNSDLPSLTAALYDLQPTILAVNGLWADQLHNVKALKDEYPAIIKNIDDIAAANTKAATAQLNQTADGIKKQQKYADDMEKIWRDGFARIAADGTRSFQRLVEDIFRMVSQLEDRITREGNGSLVDGLKKLWGGSLTVSNGIEAGIGGALAGANSGSIGGGIVSGALAGFAAGGGPFGAVIGGLAGLTGALFGGSAAAKQRKEQEDQLRQSLSQSLTSIKVQLGDMTQLDGQIADLQAQFAQRAQTIEDAYSGKKNQAEREHLLQQNSDDEKRLEQQLRDQAAATEAATKAAEEAAAAQLALADAQKNTAAQGNYQLRFLNATGQSDAAFQLQQQQELDQAIADGLDAISLRLLTQAQAAEAAQREREKQTQLLTDQLSTAQQNYDALKGVVDNLSAFKSSLAIGQYSPLSPRQQLDAARAQLNSIYQAALGGDQQAAGQFSGVAQSFLDASRKYNPSGAGYVLDYNSVNVMTDKLTAQFGQQMTDAQKQVSLLQQQLDVLKSIDAGTQVLVSRPNLTPQIPNPTPVGGGTSPTRPRLDTSSPDVVAVLQAGFTALLAAQNANTDAVDENTTLTTRKLDSLTSATLRSA